jgi:hypothetical protein
MVAAMRVLLMMVPALLRVSDAEIAASCDTTGGNESSIR